MDYIITIILIIVFLINIIVSIWSTKKSLKEERLKSVAIYRLSEEIKRHNDVKC